MGNNSLAAFRITGSHNNRGNQKGKKWFLDDTVTSQASPPHIAQPTCSLRSYISLALSCVDMLQQWTLISHYLFYLFIHSCFNPSVYLPRYIAGYVVLPYHHHFISHHFGCFPTHAPLTNVFVLFLFDGGCRFMLSDWWNGTGGIRPSELLLEQQYNRGMQVGAALKQHAFWVTGEQHSTGLLDRGNSKVN